ncbi:MAG: hypothetical protein D6758_03585 [Gammaproteobacteria bacterium]|nr:MAG: hypothetical protein D6758_03585 [Gammaproteobacteria bacterium]
MIVRPGFAAQQGAVLIIALVLLAVLSLVGTVTLAVTTVDTKVMANTADRQAAMVAAESALAVGEAALLAASKPDALGAFEATPAAHWWRTAADSYWTSKGAVSTTGGQPAQFVIEKGQVLSGDPNVPVSDLGLGYIKPQYTAYRTTGRGVGAGGSKVYLQSVFIKKQQNNAP